MRFAVALILFGFAMAYAGCGSAALFMLRRRGARGFWFAVLATAGGCYAVACGLVALGAWLFLPA